MRIRRRLNCEEVTVFDSMAERTGNVAPLRGFRGMPNVASSITDLARRHKTLGDGLFYIHEGQWPAELTIVPLAETSWSTMTTAFEESRTRPESPKKR